MTATTSPSGAGPRDVDGQPSPAGTAATGSGPPAVEAGTPVGGIAPPVTGSGPPVGEAPVTRPPLRRSSDDKVLAGVAGGLGRYLGVDPVVIRIALVVFALSGGAGVLLYLIAWIAIPEEKPGEMAAAAPPVARATGAIVLGTILLLAGGILLADRLLPGLSSFAGPLVLVALGVAVMLGARR